MSTDYTNTTPTFTNINCDVSGLISTSNANKSIMLKKTRNTRPCLSCSKARKKCELVEGSYPCKRCIHRLASGDTDCLICAPSQRRPGSRYRKFRSASEQQMRQLVLESSHRSNEPPAFPAANEEAAAEDCSWIQYDGTQGGFANNQVEQQAPVSWGDGQVGHITSRGDVEFDTSKFIPLTEILEQPPVDFSWSLRINGATEPSLNARNCSSLRAHVIA
ncbi:hypothetical protein SCHPADRAFT_890243 [Schizopora paradoxa]|uniref:Uncharacterized protein n=1 Tax=Schizopora paradoxa TaxID=27342 RepID=A0A0H2RUN1_9AGAM|nr:hypothetical protein SCHPADRAFT_890243 [Schizopora paradoxa]